MSFDFRFLEELPLVSAEKQTVLGFLKYQQQVFFNKLSDSDNVLLSDELINQSVHPSKLTLKSLISHLWWVEDYWREERILDIQMPQWSHRDFTSDPDAEFSWARSQETSALVWAVGCV